MTAYSQLLFLGDNYTGGSFVLFNLVYKKKCTGAEENIAWMMIRDSGAGDVRSKAVK